MIPRRWVISIIITIAKFLLINKKSKCNKHSQMGRLTLRFLSTAMLPRGWTLEDLDNPWLFFRAPPSGQNIDFVHKICHNVTGRLPLNLLITVMLPRWWTYMIFWPLFLSSKTTLKTNFMFLGQIGRRVNSSDCCSLCATFSDGLVWWTLQPQGTISGMLSLVNIIYSHNYCPQMSGFISKCCEASLFQCCDSYFNIFHKHRWFNSWNAIVLSAEVNDLIVSLFFHFEYLILKWNFLCDIIIFQHLLTSTINFHI